MVEAALPAGADLERKLESVECAMYADLYAAAPADVAEAHGLACERRGRELRFTVEAVDHPFFNRVMGIGLDAASPADAWIGEHAEHYWRAGIRRWMLQVLPQVEQQTPAEAFAAHGLIRLRGWAKHVGPAAHDAQADSDLQVQPIGVDHAKAWSAICADAFSFPSALLPWLAALVGREGWRHYLAWDGPDPVACAAMHHHDDVATLTFAATRPAARRRGAQSALIARRLRDAAAIGCRWVQSETDEPLPGKPNPSTSNLERFGLPVRYVRANWGPPKPSKG